MRQFEKVTHAFLRPLLFCSCLHPSQHSRIGSTASRGVAPQSSNFPALLQIGPLTAIREDDLFETHSSRPVSASKTAGGDDVAGFERVLVPAAYPHQHDRTPRFTTPFFDLAFVV